MIWDGSRCGSAESDGSGSAGIRGIRSVGGSGARRGGRSSLIAANLRTWAVDQADHRSSHLSQPRWWPNSAYPTNATVSMTPCAMTRGQSLPVRHHTAPNTTPMTMFPRPAPKP